MKSDYAFDWADLAFGNKKPIKELRATFIAAPREMSEKRFKEIIKTYLPQGDIVLGISKEPFVEGFEDQPQFRMLDAKRVQKTIDLVNRSGTPHRVYILRYFQRELPFLLEKLGFKRAVFVRGSWRHVFHVSSSYYTLMQKHTPYEMISPFVDEAEARGYAKHTAVLNNKWVDDYVHERFSEKGMLDLAAKVATFSYDYSFQTGVALGRRSYAGAKPYRALKVACNEVVPFPTYAMHYGNSREEKLSPPNDLNHYDAVHAEVELLLGMLEDHRELEGTTLFINLLPCPSCARMFARTSIEEFMYSVDHSDGYAIKMLEAAGKKVRRIVP
jgi:deoxycytidylate deaminase